LGEIITSFKPTCNSSISVQLSSQRTTSDAGALLLRETLDSSGVTTMLEDQLLDPRDPTRVQHSPASQVRTIVLQRAMGWDDLTDTAFLQNDPLWRLACSDSRGTTPLDQQRPSQPTLSCAIDLLGAKENREAIHEGLLRLAIWRLNSLKTPKNLILDVDGLPIEVFGQQQGSRHNKYVGYRHYSPLIASIAETGDMVGGLLREGNAGNAEQTDTWIPHLVRRIKDGTGVQAKVRFDAGFTGDPTLKAFEKEGIEYVGRIKSNTVLQRLAEPYLRRLPGRPPHNLREWCHDLRYQAGSWTYERRIILVVLERPDDLFLDSFFLVTNLDEHAWPPRKLLALYRKRGKAEAHMGEVKSTLNVHLSSTCRGRSTLQQVMARNEVSLLLNLYAYQIMHGLRCLMEQQTRTGWSISRLREQVLKVAATLTLHARRISVHLSQTADKWWPTLLRGLPRITALV